MSQEYWTMVAEELLDECGIVATREQINRLGGRLVDASSERGQFDGSLSSLVGQQAKEINPLQARCDKLQNALNGMARRYGVTIDVDLMEVVWCGRSGGTILATKRESL